MSMGEGVPVVHKHYGDSFEATGLDTVLTDLGVGHVVVAGAQSSLSWRPCSAGRPLAFAVVRFEIIHTAEDLGSRPVRAPPEPSIAHTTLVWKLHAAPWASTANGVAGTADIDFR